MAEEQESLPAESIDVAGELGQARLMAFLFVEWVAMTNEEKPILAGIFDKLYVSEESLSAQVRFSIYLRATGPDNETFTVTGYLPDGSPHTKMTIDTPIDYQPVQDELNIIQSFGLVEYIFPQHGTYWFEVRYGDKRIGLIPLDVLPPIPENIIENHIKSTIPSGVSTEPIS